MTHMQRDTRKHPTPFEAGCSACGARLRSFAVATACSPLFPSFCRRFWLREIGKVLKRCLHRPFGNFLEEILKREKPEIFCGCVERSDQMSQRRIGVWNKAFMRIIRDLMVFRMNSSGENHMSLQCPIFITDNHADVVCVGTMMLMHEYSPVNEQETNCSDGMSLANHTDRKPCVNCIFIF